MQTATNSAKKVIEHVSDTAYWIAAHRALESERPDALFKDPFAKKLSGEKGDAIAKKMGTARPVGWTVSVRTRLIDDFITRAISQGIDTILNLGCGLDTRPYRMELPHSLTWVEADFPHMIDFKTEKLKGDEPHCKLFRVGLDLTNADLRAQLLKDVAAKGRSVLVLTEGVMPYLTVEDGASLADALAAQPNFHFWIQDYLSPLFERLYREGKLKLEQNEPFHFFPKDWAGFFKQHGWEIAEMRYMNIEGHRMGRPAPAPFLFKMIFPFLPKTKKLEVIRLTGYALMRREK